MRALLPAGFEALEPFVDGWAVDGAAARAARRTASSRQERQTFFDAASPLVGAALDRLDNTALTEHDAAERRLMLLCLSLAHVAQAVEVQGDDEERHALHREAMRITRAAADH
ncbi:MULTISPECIES: hypothetical protein [unclassified Sphingobium]|uniref:hypothetical protein n=1 Tax=unclassified Sphingobium TaxID=2611147 RepID=UPI0007F42331|nr:MULTISPECIES: hypothetical protein [unclassified Sphingobium]OAN59349.1 hypothetical protein A7Q26_00670 [Sphingobium sp. TCM1]WIW90130.1 hypothetical protein K3M67_18900 [Sphingobium sp. V4]